ncbi:MAG TPA: DUF4173 domain-containing protein [Candidatus Limnocylindrales bacterium]|nr:DUF4173 domain-containing protein [Candidatus Limnocylindrales bacterium]
MTRRIAVRILALAGLVGWLAQAVLLENLLGINAPILAAVLLVAAWLVRPTDEPVDRADWWLPAAALAVSAGIAVRADPTLVLVDAFVACGLLGASMAALAGLRVTRRSALAITELGLLVLGWAGVGILRVTTALRRLAPPGEVGRAESLPARLPAWFVPVLRGVLIAVPILVVFTSLFAAADAAFSRIVGTLFAWELDLGELPIRAAVAFLIAWAVAGLLAVATGAAIDDDGAGMIPRSEASPGPQSLGAAAAGVPAVDRGLTALRLGAIEAATILVAVDALFAVFVVIQIAYLFGGLDTLAATGLPYAQYARSGFFELVRVAFLAGMLLAAIHAVAARRTSLLVGAGVVLAVLTAVVLASALLRLRIYQDAYGWTELRFYVLASIVWLAIGIGLTIVLLLRDRMRWLVHGLAMAAVIVLLGINVVGPSRVIAEQNVARVLDPSLVPADGRSGLDVPYAAELGDDAIPALIRALPAVHGTDQVRLVSFLRARRSDLDEPATKTGWPSWNLGREAAREALEAATP